MFNIGLFGASVALMCVATVIVWHMDISMLSTISNKNLSRKVRIQNLSMFIGLVLTIFILLEVVVLVFSIGLFFINS